jgi:hypothetical protein
MEREMVVLVMVMGICLMDNLMIMMIQTCIIKLHLEISTTPLPPPPPPPLPPPPAAAVSPSLRAPPS